jgi:L-iditol 2-dehydrogenase
VGDVDAWGQAFRLVRPGGEVHLHGGPDAAAVLRTPAAPLHYDEVTVRASYHHSPRAFRTALGLIAGGTLPFARLLGTWVDLTQVPGVLLAGGAKRPVRTRAGGPGPTSVVQ